MTRKEFIEGIALGAASVAVGGVRGNDKGYNDPGYWVKGGRAMRHIPEK